MVLLLLIVVPLVELFVAVQVASVIGGWETLLLLVLVGVAGAWLLKWQGLATIAKVSRAVSQNRVPGKELTDGFLVLVAAVFLIIPGFVSDVVALALLLPPTRALVRRPLMNRFKLGTEGGLIGAVISPTGRFVGTFRAEAYDATAAEVEGGRATGPDPFDTTGRDVDGGGRQLDP